MLKHKIDEQYDDGVIDEMLVNASGIIRLSGWSLSDDPTAPEIVNAKYLWTLRYPRADVPRPNAGVFHDYLVQKNDRVTLFSKTYRVTSIDGPPYGHMLTSERVFKRQDIYGVGPSITFVDSQIAELTTMLSGRTLDFGCGSGALVNLLRGRGLDASGIDLDTPSIRRDVIKSVVPYVTFYDGGTLPFDDRTFDWVTATEVIEHIDDFHQALAEIARVGNSLLMTVPDATAISRLSGAGVVPWHLLEATHVNFFSPRSLRAALYEHFRKVEVGQIHNTATNDQVWSVNLWAVARH